MSDEKTKQNDIVLAVPTADDVAKHLARVKDVFDEFADKQLENVARSISAKMGDDLARAQSVSWQPIETAPKDGTRVDLLLPDWGGRVTDAYWEHETDGWGDMPGPQWCVKDHAVDGWVEPVGDLPTHWMPLPAPPLDD